MIQKYIIIASGFILVYIACSILLYFISDRLIYHPPFRELNAFPASIQIPVKNGEHIAAMYIPNPKAKYTILLSHGNAEDLSSIQPLMKAFEAHGFSILAYDYRGYGKSSGRATEKNTYEDIRAAYDYLIKERHLSPKEIILYGFSIGTGPTVDLATQVPVAGVILQSPFLSAFRVVTKLPFFPLDKYRNLRKITQISAPVLVIQASQDWIVPGWHAKVLYDAIKGPKQWYSVEGAGHNDLVIVGGEDYWDTINLFSQGLKD